MKRSSMKIVALVLVVAMMTMSLTACRKSYTTGTVDGSTYTNEWAELKIDVPSGYKMYSEKDIGGAPSGFEFGCAFAADEKVPLPLCYVLTREGEADINAIGEDFTKQFGGATGLMEVSQGGVTYQVSISKDYYTIAGESFTCFHMSVSVADVYCAFRDIDGTGVIAVCVVTMNGTSSVSDIFKLFEEL